jgi:hypothetical protein
MLQLRLRCAKRFSAKPISCYTRPDEYVTTTEELAAQLERIARSEHSRSVLEIDGAQVGLLGANGSSVPRIRHAAQLYISFLKRFWGCGVGSAIALKLSLGRRTLD